MTDVGISRQKPPDGGWGWLIVLATFTIFTIAGGNVYSIGVLFVAFLDAFGRSKADTSWIGSIFGFSLCMSSSVGIALAKKLGHRKTVMISGFVVSCGILGSSFATELYHVYISYGIVTGIGLGLTFTVSIEMVSIYFKRRLKIAVGIALAGVGAGQLILSLLTQFLVETYGWRGTLIILSAFEAHVCVAGALLRPLTTEVNDPVQPSNSPVRRARDFGIGDTQSAYLPAVMGLIQLTGRPIIGVVGQIPCVKAHAIVGVVLAVFGVFTVISTYIRSFAGQLFYVGVVGICIGGFFVGSSLTISQFLGQNNIGLGTSLQMQALGVIYLASGSFAGWIRDKYGVYDIAFLTSGLVSMLMSAVTFALPYIDRALKRGRPKRPTTAIN
ncbi:monocarboxylate transporter 13-like isoform X3 [Ptychodera flava]|uniref:monocarboxylate transporter 13-like isoform X3 n=1 Tax=Ptychodera flava TaxID=63121 RepID=UPI00396A6135